MDKVVEATPFKPKNEDLERELHKMIAKKPQPLDALTEASHLIYGLKWPIYKRLSICILLTVLFPMILAILITLVMPSGQMPFFGMGIKLVNQIIIEILINIFFIQMIMLGVRQTIGLPLYLEKINNECFQVKWELLQLIVLLVLINLIMDYLGLIQSGPIGLLIFIACKLVNWVVSIPILLFAIPKVIIKKEKSITALINAYKNALLWWKKIAVSYGLLLLPYLLTGVLFILYKMAHPSSAITPQLVIIYGLLIVISILIIPLNFALSGVLFRDAYQLKGRNN